MKHLTLYTVIAYFLLAPSLSHAKTQLKTYLQLRSALYQVESDIKKERAQLKKLSAGEAISLIVVGGIGLGAGGPFMLLGLAASAFSSSFTPIALIGGVMLVGGGFGLAIGIMDLIKFRKKRKKHKNALKRLERKKQDILVKLKWSRKRSQLNHTPQIELCHISL